jgi:hypothetical protein
MSGLACDNHPLYATIPSQMDMNSRTPASTAESSLVGKRCIPRRSSKCWSKPAVRICARRNRRYFSSYTSSTSSTSSYLSLKLCSNAAGCSTVQCCSSFPTGLELGYEHWFNWSRIFGSDLLLFKSCPIFRATSELKLSLAVAA